jgi:hypothetical protein
MIILYLKKEEEENEETCSFNTKFSIIYFIENPKLFFIIISINAIIL